MKSVAVLLALALGGCQTAPVETITVKVPVMVNCIESPPQRPAYGFGKGEWVGDKMAAAILADDFERAERYGNAWEAAAVGCTKGAAP